MATKVIFKNNENEILEYEMDNDFIEEIQTEKIDNQVNSDEIQLTTEEFVKETVKAFFRTYNNKQEKIDVLCEAHSVSDGEEEKFVGNILNEKLNYYDNLIKNSIRKNGRREQLYNQAKKLNELYKEDSANITELVMKELQNKFYKQAFSEINGILKMASNSKEGKKSVVLAVNALKNSKNTEDIEKIIPILFDKKNNALFREENVHIKNFNQFYNCDKEFVLGCLTKLSIEKYFEILLSKCKFDDIYALTKAKNDKQKFSQLLLNLDSNFEENSINNGMFDLFVETGMKSIDEYLCGVHQTKCWDCSNGFVDKCPKIADINKKAIDQYDFINQGYQVVKNNSVKIFAVAECKDFEKSFESNDNSHSKLKTAMDDLAKLYYGTDTVAEAHRINLQTKYVSSTTPMSYKVRK